MNINEFFRKLAVKTSAVVGKPKTFIVALIVILTWALSGPVFGFSDTWQLFINTGTTIMTFLMVFLIQNTQNRDSKALHIKLDELLRKLKGTSSDKYVAVEELPDEEIENLHQRFRRLHDKYTKEIEERKRKRKPSRR